MILQSKSVVEDVKNKGKFCGQSPSLLLDADSRKSFNHGTHRIHGILCDPLGPFVAMNFSLVLVERDKGKV